MKIKNIVNEEKTNTYLCIELVKILSWRSLSGENFRKRI